MKKTLLWIWHLDTRVAELLIANVMLGRALSLWLPGDAHSLEIYEGFRDISESNFLWGLVFFVMGFMTYVAVIWNGRMYHTPHIRAAVSALSAAILAMMTTIFAQALSITAMMLYGSLCLSACYCVLNVAAKIPKSKRSRGVAP